MKINIFIYIFGLILIIGKWIIPNIIIMIRRIRDFPIISKEQKETQAIAQTTGQNLSNYLIKSENALQIKDVTLISDELHIIFSKPIETSPQISETDNIMLVGVPARNLIGNFVVTTILEDSSDILAKLVQEFDKNIIKALREKTDNISLLTLRGFVVNLVED